MCTIIFRLCLRQENKDSELKKQKKKNPNILTVAYLLSSNLCRSANKEHQRRHGYGNSSKEQLNQFEPLTYAAQTTVA
jgi:hypothetical protein